MKVIEQINRKTLQIIRKSNIIFAQQLKNIENRINLIKTAIQKTIFLSRNEEMNGNRSLERFSCMFRQDGWNPTFRTKNSKIIEIT